VGHHKRKKRKSSRAGCIMCKPWKANGVKLLTPAERRARDRAADQLTQVEQPILENGLKLQ
jgi:hypothetical protein